MGKTVIKSIGYLILGSIVAGGTAIAFNWTYLSRVLTHPDRAITDTDWYKPMAQVKGSPSTLPLASYNSIPQASLDKITAYSQAHNSSALLVIHQGRLVSENYWQDANSQSTSNSMSLAKTVVALLIGIAIDEEHINSELDPVAKYIPEWSKDERSEITIQDLLYMQSGLRNEDSTDSLGSDLVRMYGGTDVDSVALAVPAVKPPGKTFEYNNVNTQILGKVLELATGERYIDYLSTRLWQPLQANDAAIWLDRDRGNPKTFCCLFATAQDWGKIGQLFLGRGQVSGKQIVPSSWLDKMTQASAIEPWYGYQIWLGAKTEEKPTIPRRASQPFLASDTIYLDGKFLQKVYIIPSQDLVVVRIGEQSEAWDDAVIPNTLVGSLRDRQAAQK